MALYRCGSSGGTTDFDTIFNGRPNQQTRTYSVNIGDTLIVVSTDSTGSLTQSISGATILKTDSSSSTLSTNFSIITLCKATSSTLEVTQNPYRGYAEQIVVRLK